VRRPSAARSPALDHELLLDATVMVLGSLAIGLFAQRLWVMTVLVPSLLLVRLVLWRWVHRATARVLGREILFLVLCTVIGGFNDWNSVVHHGIYDYDAPHLFPGFSTIPLWMLLFWGLILRFLATLTASAALGAPRGPEDAVRLGPRVVHSASLKVGLLLALVAVTRQCIYRCYLDPWWSWIPFAVAFGAYWALFGLGRNDLRLAAIALVGGPLIEVLYIQVGHLHHYHLGWFGGVPLWIVLWWVLAILVWKDLAGRLRHALGHLLPSVRRKEGLS